MLLLPADSTILVCTRAPLVSLSEHNRSVQFGPLQGLMFTNIKHKGFIGIPSILVLNTHIEDGNENHFLFALLRDWILKIASAT